MRANRESSAAGLQARWDLFEGGAERFFFKGTNGRWRDVLTAEDLELYERAASELDPELRNWLENGRLGR